MNYILEPERLREEIESYIAQCGEADVFPDLPGMRLFLGITKEQLKELQDSPKCNEALNYAADCRESWLVRKMCEDNKLSTACMNVLRQSENGGYGEKDEAKGLEIHFSGNMGKEDFL